MKKRTLGIITYAVVIATTIICATSCTSTVTKHNIATADSIVNVNPKAALAFIDSVTGSGDLSRASKMKFALLKAKARNKLYLPADTAMLETLAEYYDNHGTANDRMLTQYIIGCSYIDRNDAPRALQSFQDAIEMADTTDTECDYGTLSRIYSQMSNILNDEMSFTYALEAGKKSIRYALAAKDTFNAISGYSYLTASYYFTQPDSVLSVNLKAAEMYKEHGYIQDAAATYGIPIFLLIEKGKLKEAKPYMDLYETYSGIYDSKTKTTKKGHEIYYYVKGMYYVLTHNLDSAEYFARKELRTTSDFDNRQGAAKCLYMIYKKKRQTDSIIKYAEMWNAATDSAYANMSTTHLQQMRAKYDYSQSERIAERNAAEATRMKLLAAIFVLALVLSLFFILFIMQKRKKDAAIAKQLNAKNALYLLLLDKKERELREAQNAKQVNEILIKEKVAEVKNLQDKLSELHGLSIETDIDRDKNIHEAAITYHLHEIASSGCKAKQSDIDELQKLFETNMQHFIAALNKYNRLNKTETIICCLVKLNFIPSEIGCLLNISPQSLTNIRKRLNKKIFGVDGGAKDLDYKVRKLRPNN